MTEEECSDSTLQEIQAKFSDCAVKQEFDFEERKTTEEGTLEVRYKDSNASKAIKGQLFFRLLDVIW